MTNLIVWLRVRITRLLIGFLKELVDSDIAMREEDEGNVSPLLEKARTLISQYNNSLDGHCKHNSHTSAQAQSSEISVVNAAAFKQAWERFTWREDSGVAYQFIQEYLHHTTKPVSVSLEKCSVVIGDVFSDYPPDETAWERLLPMVAKAVLDAAGVKYVD